jgi:hypothetical protein
MPRHDVVYERAFISLNFPGKTFEVQVNLVVLGKNSNTQT